MQATKVEGFQLSPQQRRLWTLHGDRSDSPYTAGCTVRIRGNVDVPVLRNVIERLPERHEILGTTFYASPAMRTAVQVVGSAAPVVDVRDLTGLDRDEQRRVIDARHDETLRRPYDFAAGPLVRACVTTISSDEHILLLGVPALCCDAAGLNNLVAEICRCYDALVKGAELSDEVLQYVDASIWLNEALSSVESAAGRQFWQQCDCRTAVEQKLPFETRSANVDAFDPRHVMVGLESVNLSRVESLVPGHEVSLDGFMLACWRCLLQRITRDTRLGVGYVSDGRGYAELEHAIGLFARCLPITGELGDGLPFSDALSQVEEALRNAKQWGECFDWTGAAQTGSVAPYAAFTYERRDSDAPFAAAGVEFTVDASDACTDRFKIKLVACRRTDTSLAAALEYDATLYREEDVQRLAGQLATLIEDALERPHATLDALRILPDAQRREVVVELNAGSVPFAAGCVHRLFEAQVARTPTATAVVCEDERLTYAELNARANQLARYLQKRGVGPDVRVALCVERSVASVVGILGILKAGGAYVPLDPQWPQSRLALTSHESGAPVILTEATLAARLPSSTETVLLDGDAGRIASEPSSNLTGEVLPEHLVYVIFTSGSTGAPKGVCIEHRQLVNYVHGLLTRLELSPGATFATVTTLAADLGNTAIYPALTTGGCLHILSESRASDPEAFAEYFERHPIDVLKIVPSHLKALLSCSRPARVLPRQRLVLGGEACPWDLVDDVRRLAPACGVFNHYGPTETTVGATTWRIAQDDARLAATVPIGRPLPHAAVYVLDRHRQPVPVWVAGELHIGGAGVARGYLNAPDLTADKFIEDPFSTDSHARLYRTGDLVRILPTGALEFLGRIDDQVKIRGFRIELGEIEAALRRHPAVGDAAVLVREDAAGEKRLVAWVAARGRSRLDTTELIAFLKTELPEYMVPASIAAVDALPLTANGKLDRQALLARADVASAPSSSSEPPSTPWEQMVAGVWRELLQTDEVGVHDNFYDLGGHSLLAIQVITAIEKHTGLQISPRDLVFHTLRQFAALCESRAAVDGNVE